MQVHTSIGGSVMVLTRHNNFEHYIDARNDVRTPDSVSLELVHGGQVKRRIVISKANAPEKIIDWAQEWGA